MLLQSELVKKRFYAVQKHYDIAVVEHVADAFNCVVAHVGDHGVLYKGGLTDDVYGLVFWGDFVYGVG